MDTNEYERRRSFCDLLKTMERSEHVEIARILRKHNVAFSENRSGLYFDMAKIPQPVFDEMLKFRDFVIQNNAELHHQLRAAGIRRSSKVREVLQRNHTGFAKRRWLASLIQNPKFQPTDLHVAAKSWVLRAPNGSIHTFRNLRNFIRENEELFDAVDVIWKAQNRRPKLT
jgi:hypothetical protein